MSDIYKIIVTSCLTIIGGVIVFLTSKVIDGFVIAPLIEQGKAIGEIARILYYLGEVFASPLDTSNIESSSPQLARYLDAKVAIRKAASDLIRGKWVRQMLPVPGAVSSHS